MTYRDIRIVGDPVLRTVCAPITDITPGIRQLVDDLMENVNEPGRAGLAANQIGQSFRAFSWNIDGKRGYILNPVIVELSEDEYQDGDEGCLSVPELWYPCKRAWYAKAEGTDLDGNKVVVEGEEIWGRLIQHEVDHLDGHLYIDRLERAERKKALREIREKGM
ncbi:peptide deformylase [Arcanobacterium bovis]|uniref:Peptide deformylase n=1 Tax=Arcanobacterium bovis TaxID=2529275 RepID=A0A4Q9V127_9ACTO|nr:peptide deformylase [Arcanobacterium bovis]TBW22786.1 peptide deformylase [Arcanobacterium bovis]